MGVLSCHFRPKMFSPGDHVRYHTHTHCHANRACATIQSVLFSYPEVLYRSFGSSITFVLDETHWHRINAKVASHVFSLLASVEGTTVCLEIPLQSPPPPGGPSLGDRLPPPPGRPSRATPGLCKGGGGYECSTWHCRHCTDFKTWLEVEAHAADAPATMKNLPQWLTAHSSLVRLQLIFVVEHAKEVFEL